MRPIYEALGVTVSAIQEGDDPPRPARESTPATSPTAPTPVRFDYLRDNMAGSLRKLRPASYEFAIVDEVDNILIDEARTPADHLRPPEQARPTTPSPPRQQMKGEAHKEKLKSLGESKDTRDATTTTVRREAQDGRATEAGSQKARSSWVENLYLGEHGTLVNH